MNTVLAICGHWVPAFGAEGSFARQAAISQPCVQCRLAPNRADGADADAVAQLRAEIADLKARIAALESRQHGTRWVSDFVGE